MILAASVLAFLVAACGGGGGGSGGTPVSPPAAPPAPVNRTPTLTGPLLFTTPSNTAVSGLVGASDLDTGDTLSWGFGTPLNGTLPATTPATGAFTYEPRSGFVGTDTFTVTVRDSVGATVSGNVTITVTSGGAINRPPVFVTNPLTVTGPNNADISGSMSATDPDGDPVSVTNTTAVPISQGTFVSFASNGAFVFRPAPTFSGRVTVQVTAGDSRGGTTPGLIQIDVAAPPNRPPTANAGADIRLWEQDRTTLAGMGMDPEGDPLTYRWEQVSGPSAIIMLPTRADTSVDAPAVSAVEALTFRLTVTDAAGATASDTVTITLSPLEDIQGPILANRTLSGNYEVPADITVASGITLTIAPGTMLRFHANKGLLVAGSLQTAGTGFTPVFFTSLKSRPAVHSERWAGISCLSCTSSAITDAVLEHAIVAVKTEGLTIVQIANNVFRDAFVGITDDSGYQPYDISRNTFLRVSEAILGLRTLGASALSRNRFANVQTAISRGYYFGDTMIEYNDFAGATEAIRSSRPLAGGETATVTAPNNWWGTTDPARIPQLIYDRYDDATLMEIPFLPFLVAPPEAGSTIPSDIPVPAP
jgi:hypothetical protein